jgi:hypothetical protein
VQRHHPVLGETEDAENVEHVTSTGLAPSGRIPVLMLSAKSRVPVSDVDQDHRRQDQALGGGGQVNDVLLGPFVALPVLVMGDQGVGADADDFIEEIEGEEVVGKGDPHGPEQGQGETGVEPGLGMLVQPPHVAGRVENRQNPEKGSGQGEDQGKGVHPQGHRNPGQNLEDRVDQGLAGQDQGNHRGDDGEHHHRRHQGPGLPDIGIPPGEHHQDGADQGGQQSQERF